MSQTYPRSGVPLSIAAQVPSGRASARHRKQIRYGKFVMSGFAALIGLALIMTSVPLTFASNTYYELAPKTAVKDVAATQSLKVGAKAKSQSIVRDVWSVDGATITTSASSSYFKQFSKVGAGERMRNAAIVIEIGKKRGFSARDIKIALAVAIQESNLYNDACCDHLSHGIFQQQYGMGWGTLAQTLDPVHATNAFYNALAGVHNRDSQSMISVAMQVQRPNRYAYTSTWYKYGRELAAAQIYEDLA